MIVHRTCHTQVKLDLSPAYKFIATFGITDSGIRTSICDVIQDNTEGPVSFYCEECHTIVPIEGVVVLCEMCGEYFEVADSWRSTKAGGMYCERDAREYFPGEIKRLNLRKFTIVKSR